jgi:hypothetical protein
MEFPDIVVAAVGAPNLPSWMFFDSHILVATVMFGLRSSKTFWNSPRLFLSDQQLMFSILNEVGDLVVLDLPGAGMGEEVAVGAPGES